MHPSSQKAMAQCYDRYIVGSALETQDKIRVLDVGGAINPKGYYPIFQNLKGKDVEYIGSDLRPRPGVSMVFKDPYKIPLRRSSVSIVISGQTFEHCEFFWLLFEEMVRVVKPDGYIFLISPSGGPIHRYPVDCYRFYPDSYRALAKYTKAQALDIWRSDVEPWRDLVGIFRKQVRPPPPAIHTLLAAARTDMEGDNFKAALEKYAKAETEFGTDRAFIGEFLKAAGRARNNWQIYRLGMKLIDCFDPNVDELLIFGQGAVKLGRKVHAQRALGMVKERCQWQRSAGSGSVALRATLNYLTAVGLEMTLGTDCADPSLVKQSAIDAAQIFLAGTAVDPANRWVFRLAKIGLKTHGESDLLAKLTAVPDTGSNALSEGSMRAGVLTNQGT